MVVKHWVGWLWLVFAHEVGLLFTIGWRGWLHSGRLSIGTQLPIPELSTEHELTESLQYKFIDAVEGKLALQPSLKKLHGTPVKSIYAYS